MLLNDFLLSIAKKEVGSFEDIILQMVEFFMQQERKEFLAESVGTNKGNGYRTRFQEILKKKFTIKIPRDRLGIFKPFILEMLRNEDTATHNLICSLYQRGLSTRDIEGILQDLYGNTYSKSAISRISKETYTITRLWQKRTLSKSYVVIYIDATFIPIRRDTVSKEEFYVLFGLREDNTREVLCVYTFPTENSEDWKECLQDIQQRGVKNVLLFVADGLTGIDQAIAATFGRSRFQQCIVHKMRTLNKKVRISCRKEIMEDFKSVLRIDDADHTKKAALQLIDRFIEKWSKKYPSIRTMFPQEERSHYVTFLDFPFGMRKMIYTTNWIENLNKSIKRTTKIRGSFPNEASALSLVRARCMERNESNYLKYPVTTLHKLKGEIKKMFDTIKH